jgi:hypothetical protein
MNNNNDDSSNNDNDDDDDDDEDYHDLYTQGRSLLAAGGSVQLPTERYTQGNRRRAPALSWTTRTYVNNDDDDDNDDDDAM